MVNCRRCRREEPLNLVCFDAKCGQSEGLKMICCKCHSSLFHQTIPIDMFLDIACITTKQWISGREEATCLMDGIDQLIDKL